MALGCGQYRVLVRDRTGAPMGELSGISSLTWNRELSEISSATLIIQLADSQPVCCELIGKMRTWRHEIVVYRDGEAVWSGPVVEIRAGFTQVVITANDVLVWLSRRLVAQDLNFTGDNAADLTDIARIMINDAFADDDPARIMDNLYIIDSNIEAERSYFQYETYILNILSDFDVGGIDYTTLLNRIIIGPEEGSAFGDLGRWGDMYFPDGYEVVESGLDSYDFVVVRGGTLGDSTTVQVTQAGALAHTEYFGRRDYLRVDNSILDVNSANTLAKELVDAASIPPVSIVMAEGSLLSPDAPVEINELVCGATMQMYATGTCRQIRQTLRLHRVDVEDNGDGERVTVTFSPPSTDVSGL